MCVPSKITPLISKVLCEPSIGKDCDVTWARDTEGWVFVWFDNPAPLRVPTQSLTTVCGQSSLLTILEVPYRLVCWRSCTLHRWNGGRHIPTCLGPNPSWKDLGPAPQLWLSRVQLCPMTQELWRKPDWFLFPSVIPSKPQYFFLWNLYN